MNGTWVGRWWGPGQQGDMTVTFGGTSDGVWQGQGSDWVGPFTFRLLESSGNVVQLEKRYARYSWIYKGTVSSDLRSINGTWGSGSLSGKFYLNR